MSNKENSTQAAQVTSSEIAKIFGPTQLLPGESEEAYNLGLAGTIRELDARTHLQVYLAEKIFQCLWWLRRYEIQKHALTINAMVSLVVAPGTPKPHQQAITAHFQANKWQTPSMLKIMENNGHTPESLLAKALSKESLEIQKIDQQIALRTKTLGQLQQSYEALVNRSVLQERLQLQNELIKRDLQAIDVPSLNSQSASSAKPHGKSKAKSG
jgi:hypothetical protein